MARSRNPDDYDDEPGERPQRRPRDEDDEPEERPRRRRRDDDDDAPSSRSGDLGPLDKMYRDTNIIVLILFGCCCGLIAFIMSLICYLTAKDPKAKSNAMIVLIISGILSALNIIAAATGQLNNLGGRP